MRLASENLWKFLETFLLAHYFQKLIEWMCLTPGYTHSFILVSNIFFVAIIYLFDITYLSKCLYHTKSTCKTINYGPRAQRSGKTSSSYYERQDGVYAY